MDDLTPEGLSTLSKLLRHVFGSGVDLDGYSVANRRDDYLVLVVILRRPTMRVVVKLAGPLAPIACPFEQSAWVHNLVRAQSSAPVAKIFAADTSYAGWPWRYVIKEYVEGIEWADLQSRLKGEDAEDVYTQVAQAAAELHSIHFARFGDLPAGGTVWWSNDFVEALRTRAGKRIKNRRHFDIFSRVLDERAGLFSDFGEPCLCHEDLHKHNVIFRCESDRWRLASILDFDSAWAGCHESDLARLEMWNSKNAQSIIHDYSEMHFVSPEYPERRPVFQLLWCLEYASETPRHLADTRAVCSELGIRAIESFGEET